MLVSFLQQNMNTLQLWLMIQRFRYLTPHLEHAQVNRRMTIQDMGYGPTFDKRASVQFHENLTFLHGSLSLRLRAMSEWHTYNSIGTRNAISYVPVVL